MSRRDLWPIRHGDWLVYSVFLHLRFGKGSLCLFRQPVFFVLFLILMKKGEEEEMGSENMKTLKGDFHCRT
jgi:hypothetical protein